MSKVAGFVAGAALITFGVLTGGVLLLPGTAFATLIGSSSFIVAGASLILSETLSLLQHTPARQASEMSIQLGEQPRSAFFGEGFTAGSLVDAFNFGGKYGTDWECLIIRLADHKCAGLTGFYVNDTYVPYTGNGNYAQFNSHKGTDQLHVYFRADTSSEALPAEVTANWPGWAASDTGQSGCDVCVLYKADKPKVKHPVWPGGRPRFGFILQGKLCYDPRLDDTVGGSGSHRWDDPSTWEWSENAAVCRYNWVRGIYANDQVGDPTQLLIGRGLSAAEAPPANIFAAANLCDETVDDGVRYRVAGPVYANQQFLEVEEMFAAATGGTIVTREGSVELEPGAAKSVVAIFTDDDLLVGSSVSWNEAILSESDSGWINTVIANYVEPAQQWNNHDAPVVRNTADLVADGGPREASPSLRLVKDVSQALRVAEITRRLGRLWGRGGVTLGPRFCEIEEGDWVGWQSQRRFGGATRTFRVEAYSIDEKWQNTLTLREISADVYGDDAVFDPDYSVATPTEPPTDVGSPDETQWALAAVTLTSGGVSVPALEITGDASDDDSVEAIEFEYWKADGIIDPTTDPDDPEWVMEGSHSPDTTKVDITGVEGGTDYYVAVTYVVSGESGDRLVLGPVTTADIDVTGAVAPIVDAAVGKLAWKEPVRAKTTGALPANTYANGAGGAGATLTGTANGALAAQDGVTLVAGDRLLVDQEAAGSHNGIYVVTQVGDATHPFILTRADDADEPAELVNAAAKVSEGTAHADEEWQCTTNAMIVVGTTALVWEAAGGGIGVTDGDKGDIIVSSSGTVWEIDDDVVGPDELADTAVVPGSYLNANVTVDQQGRITDISEGAGAIGAAVVAAVSWSVAAGVVSIISQNNVASVSRSAAGLYTVNFTVDLPSANYIVIGGGRFADFTASNTAVVGVDRRTSGPHNRKTASLVDIMTSTIISPAVTDVTEAWIICIDISLL